MNHAFCPGRAGAQAPIIAFGPGSRPRFLGGALLLGSVVLLLLVIGRAPGQGPGPAASNDPASSPLDPALRLIAAARQSYEQVQDYTCLFIKRESIDGRLHPDQILDMRVRTRPFSVYFHFLAPQDMAGQQACYVAGRNDGKMRVHLTGLRGAVGFISLDPDDPRVTKNNRHTIREAGIGNLIERYGKRWEEERGQGLTQIRIGEFEYNKRRCTRVETIHPPNSRGQFYAFRNVLYFDNETHLPVRTESYDWPRPNGPAQGELLESYSYVNLRLNVRLGDEVFNH